MAQTNILSAPHSVLLKRSERLIGAILVDGGRLSAEGVERILHLQHERGLRFGEAGKALRLLSQADIDYALARQFDYPYLLGAEGKLNRHVVAAYDPFGPRVEALRALRNQLMLRWADAHKFDLSALKNLMAYKARVAARPQVQAALKSEGLA